MMFNPKNNMLWLFGVLIMSLVLVQAVVLLHNYHSDAGIVMEQICIDGLKPKFCDFPSWFGVGCLLASGIVLLGLCVFRKKLRNFWGPILLLSVVAALTIMFFYGAPSFRADKVVNGNAVMSSNRFH